jgi:hypothetical protein
MAVIEIHTAGTDPTVWAARVLESLFAGVGSDFSTAYIDDGSEVRNWAVAFANGGLKTEGERPLPWTASPLSPLLELEFMRVAIATVEAVLRHFPNHAAQTLRWRCRPKISISGGAIQFYLRVAAE